MGGRAQNGSWGDQMPKSMLLAIVLAASTPKVTDKQTKAKLERQLLISPESDRHSSALKIIWSLP